MVTKVDLKVGNINKKDIKLLERETYGEQPTIRLIEVQG